MKKYSGVIVIVILSLFPVFLWLRSTSPSSFSGWSNIFLLIGKLAGLVGMALFSINFILATRFKWLEDYFNGIDQAYIKHHITGAIAFCLLLIHPMTLALNLLSFSPEFAVGLFIPNPANYSVLFGQLALNLMVIFLVLTFYGTLRYHKWKITHKFLGLAFFFASLHIFLIGSDISADPWLKYYFFTLVSLAWLAIFYRTILGYFLVKKYPYRIKDINVWNDSITNILMEPVGKPLSFEAGQFVFVSFISPKLSSESHPYSITTAPGDRNLGIAIKSLGDHSSLVKNLDVGTSVKIEGPYGRFGHGLVSKTGNQIWIAGGIGITPFLSMGRYYPHTGKGMVDLYYAVNSKDEAVFLQQLTDLSDKEPNLRVIPHFSSESGFLTAEIIKHQSGALTEKDIYLCGPTSMMSSLREQLETLGVSKTRIHFEDFALV